MANLKKKEFYTYLNSVMCVRARKSVAMANSQILFLIANLKNWVLHVSQFCKLYYDHFAIYFM